MPESGISDEQRLTCKPIMWGLLKRPVLEKSVK